MHGWHPSNARQRNPMLAKVIVMLGEISRDAAQSFDDLHPGPVGEQQGRPEHLWQQDVGPPSQGETHPRERRDKRLPYLLVLKQRRVLPAFLLRSTLFSHRLQPCRLTTFAFS